MPRVLAEVGARRGCALESVDFFVSGDLSQPKRLGLSLKDVSRRLLVLRIAKNSRVDNANKLAGHDRASKLLIGDVIVQVNDTAWDQTNLIKVLEGTGDLHFSVLRWSYKANVTGGFGRRFSWSSTETPRESEILWAA